MWFLHQTWQRYTLLSSISMPQTGHSCIECVLEGLFCWNRVSKTALGSLYDFVNYAGEIKVYEKKGGAT